MTIQFSIALVALLTLAACGPVTESGPTKAATVATDTAHNSQNALDWAGSYLGVLPCADCEGIRTTLELHPDQTYQLSRVYLGESDELFQSTGQFEWDSTGRQIRLLAEQDGPSQYLVQENLLLQLDMAGNPIDGALAAHYQLTKQNPDLQMLAGSSDDSAPSLTGVRWQLQELAGQPVQGTPAQRPYIEFGTDGRISGFSGCNQFTGGYETEGLRLRFLPLATTQKACAGGELESQFLQVLQGIDNFSVNGNELTFYKARTAALLKFTALDSST
ncbi:copper resistance protein NlpE N-terminal domain-containing protein [Rheinheimera sp.]|uniref:copper resistance protein NlpE N-terminal domain-containing protein n=1 Tax=Rheinheimera sp. TaxID=1869214 RepID=UPI00307EE87D